MLSVSTSTSRTASSLGGSRSATLAWTGLMRARPHTRARAMASSSDRDAKGGASRKGDSYEQKTRRRGRPAWMRSPYDSPLRDGNRDRLVGLLTGKTSVTKNPEVTYCACRSLIEALAERDPALSTWIAEFRRENPIPRNGVWDDVSGETFLRKLLTMNPSDMSIDAPVPEPVDEGEDEASVEREPRSVALRIMDIRLKVAEEAVVDLEGVADANVLLYTETLTRSLTGSSDEECVPETWCSVEWPELDCLRRKASIIGLLTDRSTKTLACYLMETNVTLYGWWVDYLRSNPIHWDAPVGDPSGDMFLRKLLTSGTTTTSWGELMGVNELYRNFAPSEVDPRSLAQRVMDIRASLSKEFIQDLSYMGEENAILLREAFERSLEAEADVKEDVPTRAAEHE